MDEIAFFSTEADVDSENPDDETDTSSSKLSAKELQSGDNVPKLEIPFSSNFMSHGLDYNITDPCSDLETVEICQSTVNPHVRVNSENFKIQRVIGKGGYGKVFLVQKVDGVDQGKLYAMKVLKKARLVCNEKDKAHTVSERNILQMLRHPFLVKLHYAFQNHSNLYIVLEYCPGGELFNYLEREGALLENSACFYTAEIVLAIGHLHSLGIIYRDLKSENVLLDRQGHVKLTDFGLSKEGVCTTNTFCGTIEYMAPEIIRCEGHGKAVDWWSLGTLLFDMLSGGPPFTQEDSREATTRKILYAPIKFPATFSPEVTSLIRGLLKRDPRERLGSRGDVEEVKRHKFFRRHDINWSDVYHRRLKPPFRPKLQAENDVSMFDPTFTRLQPIVSPADSNRPIPPDMFQGFSYVAPSVCEDAMREPWVESCLSSQRRHGGPRGSQSAGRLRRMDATSTAWSAKASETARLRAFPRVSNTGKEHPNAPREFAEFSNGYLQKGRSTLPVVSMLPEQYHSHFPATTSGGQPELSISNLVSRPNIPGNVRLPIGSTLTHGTVMEGLVVQEDDEDVLDVDEEDEELEEENVPGAQEIHANALESRSGSRIISPVKSSTVLDKLPAQGNIRSSVQSKALYSSNMSTQFRQPVQGSLLFSSASNVNMSTTTQSATCSNPTLPAPSTNPQTSKCMLM